MNWHRYESAAHLSSACPHYRGQLLALGRGYTGEVEGIRRQREGRCRRGLDTTPVRFGFRSSTAPNWRLRDLGSATSSPVCDLRGHGGSRKKDMNSHSGVMTRPRGGMYHFQLPSVSQNAIGLAWSDWKQGWETWSSWVQKKTKGSGEPLASSSHFCPESHPILNGTPSQPRTPNPPDLGFVLFFFSVTLIFNVLEIFISHVIVSLPQLT